MKNFLSAHKKAVLIMLTIILITLTCVSATQDNTTIHKNTSNPKIIKDITQNTIKTENPEEIILTGKNYQNYKDYEYPSNSKIIINDTINDTEFYIYNKNITLTGQNGATLSNSHIEVFDDGSIHLSNLTFTTNDESRYSKAIILETDNNMLENLNFYETRTTADNREKYRQIDLYGDNNTIINCTFELTQPSKHINWDTDSSECPFEAICVHGDKNNISSNVLLIQEAEEKDYPFGTIFAISIRGDNNTVDSNVVLMQGTLYLYGIRIYQSNNTVTNNYVEVNSIRYANGIAIESPGRGITGNNKVINNTVIVTTQNATVPGEPRSPGLVDAAYGIMVTEYKYTGGGLYTGEKSNTVDNLIESNTITGSSSQIYAIELFGGKGTSINKNTIQVEGVSAMGIAGGGAGTSITNNRMEVYGQTNQTFYSADYYKPQTGGINLQYGTGTTISGNTIITDNGPAIRSLGEGDTTISDNIIDVNNNEVAIDIKGPRGLTEIIGNAITNLKDQIINGGSSSGNYDPSEIQENPQPENPTSEDQNKSTSDNETDIPENSTDIPENSTDISENNTEVPENKTEEIENNTEIPENKTEIPENSTEVPENKTEEIENNTEIPENKTEIPENKTEVPENKTEIPENKTEVPENTTDIPKPEEQNLTIIPETPEENNTEIIEPEPQNNTETPITKPEQNVTEIPVINDTQEEPIEENQDQKEQEQKPDKKPEEEEQQQDLDDQKEETTPKPQEDESIDVEINETTTNTTTTPDIIIENTTTIPIKNSTNPSEGELVEDIEKINKTDSKRTNQTTSAGEKPDNSKDDSESETTPQEPQPSENVESESEESEDTEQLESEQSESSVGNNQDSKVGATATVDSSKVYEINKKIPDDLMPEHPEIIIVLLLTLCIAFTYGYLKKKR